MMMIRRSSLLAAALSGALVVANFIVEEQATVDDSEQMACASVVPWDSSLVPLDAEMMLDDPFSQCIWLHPVAMPAGAPEQLALAPPPLTLQTGPEPEIDVFVQAESPPLPPQPPPEKSKAASIVPDGGVKETERPNVAAAQDGARLLFANPEAKKPGAILSGDSFSFMKNNCGDDKFVVIELSQRVKLTSLEITMIELYSSRARTVDLYSTLTKPVKAPESPWLLGDWAYHATVKAENKKGDHVFNFASKEFTRYLLLHFTSHHGSESVCTINNVRVFGVTETEDLEAQLEALQDATVDAAAATAAFAAAAADLVDLSDLADIDLHGSLDDPASDADTLRSTSFDVDAAIHMHVGGSGNDATHGSEAEDDFGYELIATGEGVSSDSFDSFHDSVHVGEEADVGAESVIPGMMGTSSGAAETAGGSGTSVSQEPEQGMHASTPPTEEKLELQQVTTGAAGGQEDQAQSQHSTPEPAESYVGAGEPIDRASTDSNTGASALRGSATDGEPRWNGEGSEDLPVQKHAKGSQGSNVRADGDSAEGGSANVPGSPAVESVHAGESASDKNPAAATHATSQPGEDTTRPNPSAGKRTTAHLASDGAASKGGAGDTHSLLIGDGSVTGMYQPDVHSDNSVKDSASAKRVGAPVDETDASAGTAATDTTAAAAAAASAAGNSARKTEGPGKSTSSNTAPSRKVDVTSPSTVEAAPSKKGTADVPTGGLTQQQRAAADNNAGSAPGSTVPGTGATGTPQSPPGVQPAHATQPRAPASPAGGHSTVNANANGHANVNATTSGSSSASTTPPVVTGEGAAATTSKTGSVYDTIKKELLSLRVETSTLSKSLGATATISNVTALTRRHDATLKRVSAVSSRVNELEQVLAGLQLAGAEAARAQQRLQREVSAAIVLSVVAIALGIFSYLSYRSMADLQASRVSVNSYRSSSHQPVRPRSNGGPVFFYPRSQSYADLPHQPTVPHSHSTQSLPCAAMQLPYLIPGSAYGRSGSAPSSHAQLHHTTLHHRSRSGTTAVLPHMGILSPPLSRQATASTPPPGPGDGLVDPYSVSSHQQRIVEDRERASEYHDPVHSDEGPSVAQSGPSALFGKHRSGNMDVHGAHAYHTVVWNSDSAFDGPTHAPTMVPPILRRSCCSNSIHSISSHEALTRRHRSRASSGLLSPVTNSPTHASHAALVAISHPHHTQPPHHSSGSGNSSGDGTSRSGSAAVRQRRGKCVLARSSAPTASRVAPPDACAHSARDAKSTVTSSTDVATGNNASESTTPPINTTAAADRELDSANRGDSTDTEDLLPAPTFAHLMQQRASQPEVPSCGHDNRSVAAQSTSHLLPLISDTCAHCAPVDTTHSQTSIFQDLAISTFPVLGSDGLIITRDDCSRSHGSSPLSHGSRGGSGPTSPELPVIHKEQRSYSCHPSLHSPPSQSTREATVQNSAAEGLPTSFQSTGMSAESPTVADNSNQASNDSMYSNGHRGGHSGSAVADAEPPTLLQAPIHYGAAAYSSMPPAALVVSADGTRHANSGSLHGSISPQRRSLTRQRSRPAQDFGSNNGARSVPLSAGSVVSDTWGGSDNGSNRGNRGRSVHVLRCHPSLRSLPGSEPS